MPTPAPAIPAQLGEYLVAVYLDRFEGLSPARGFGRAEPHREPAETGPDAEGGAVDRAGLERPPGPPPVHGVPLDRAAGLAGFEYLGHAGRTVDHHQVALGEERAETRPDLVGSERDHDTAEIFVNRIVGSIPYNLFPPDSPSRRCRR